MRADQVRGPSRLPTIPALIVALAAVSSGSAVLAQKPGGSITVGLEADVSGFDPLKVGTYDLSVTAIAATLFDTLATLDDAGKAVPKLAVSWTHSEDFRTWAFKLRTGVKFHDGTPLNAQAVKWNYDRQKDPANKCRCAFYIANLLRVEAPDETTVVYHLKDPKPMFPESLARPSANSAIHSPAAVMARGDAYNRNPVGTGPFMLKFWASGDRVVVERNPNYWKPGQPRLDRITFRPLPDAPARFASLQAGEVDIAYADEYDPANLKKAKVDRRFVVHEHPGSGAWVYAFNTKRAPFDDLRVRRALVMAIDRRKMSQALTGGLARPATNPYGDGSWVKCSDDGALPHDPVAARELLRAYGKPVQFKVLVTATPRGRAVGQVLQQFWKQIGATVELEQVDQATIAPRAFKRDFDLTPWRIVDFPDPDIQMYANFRSGSPVALANYSNPELDAMLERARSSVDRRVQNADYCEIGRLVNQQAIWFWTFQNTAYAIGKAKLKGVPRLFGAVIDLSAAWIDQAGG